MAIECRRNKADFVSMVTHPVAPVTAAALRLVVRHADYVAAANAEFADDPNRRPVAERIGDDLYAVLASAGPMTTMLVSRAMLVKLKLTPATAWALAARQTAAELPPIPTRAMMKGGGVGVEGFDYTASLLLDRKAWAGLAKAIGDDLFVTVVSDDFLFVGIRPDGHDMDRFRPVVIKDCAAQSHCISPHIYRFRDGRWTITP